MDTTYSHNGVNTNLYTISPEGGVDVSGYCDIPVDGLVVYATPPDIPLPIYHPSPILLSLSNIPTLVVSRQMVHHSGKSKSL